MSEELTMPGENRLIEKTPGHWVLAQLGKKVLRPGGKELTNKMLHHLNITPEDKVVEFAPGMGYTTRLCLQNSPANYTAIEQNEQAAAIVRSYLNGVNQTCCLGSAQETGLKNAIATVVYGEAMLTMQSDSRKQEIITEAARILQSSGRYGIHELCICPDQIDPEEKRLIQKEITETIQHPAKPLTPKEWEKMLEECGFDIEYKSVAPMHLLEPKRMIDDEGLFGFFKIVRNLFFKPGARKRVFGMRRIFRKHRNNLAAITLVAKKKEK
ncbi:SAM-dependent methyltransferase [Vibrio sp. HA2012]|uniref:class I SAM-dependent methyltransferase n=1 Tax=Vibrio sp. HA2012 TaxID=1971595 RepID=UPI000C2B5374|nr:class I SAM-dependent methyltransferase [Vibrio sp. HA2012]PJC86724.1 SAM-dependent methyltransferase [Vibrio sp. HA2012]